MRLRSLDAEFVSQYNPVTGSHHRQGDQIDGAQGVLFLCPLCQKEMILCWFANPINAPRVPDSAYPRPGRWTASGNSVDNLTLSPSVNLDTHEAQTAEQQGYHPCKWHGWVRNGDAQ